MNAVIADGWTFFGYNGPKHETEENLILVASKDACEHYEIYKDFSTPRSRFICFQDDCFFYESEYLSKVMYKVDKEID